MAKKGKGLTPAEQDELKSVQPKGGARDDLDEEEFNIDEYTDEFKLSDELKSPAYDDDEEHAPVYEKNKKSVKATAAKQHTEKHSGNGKESKKKEKMKESKSSAARGSEKTTLITEVPVNQEETPVEPTPEETQETPLLTAPQDDDDGTGWWIALLIILIVIASGIAYRLSQDQATTSAGCTNAFVTTLGSPAVDGDKVTGVASAWFAKGMQSTNPTEARNIFRMLSCGDAQLTAKSDPSVITCTQKSPAVIVSEESIKRAFPDAQLLSCDIVGSTARCDGHTVHTDTLIVDGSDTIAAVKLVTGEIKSQLTGKLSGDALILVQDSPVTYKAVQVPLEQSNAVGIGLWTGSLASDRFVARYVTRNPRIVTVTLAD